MNKEKFDLRNCVIIELENYDYIMKNYNYIKTERNDLQDRIDKAIEYIEKESWFMYKDDKLVIDRTPVEELLNILKGNDNND